MASTALADRHATAQEVREHARAIRKLVDRFGLSNARLYGEVLGLDASAHGLRLACREVLVHGGRRVEVVGPLLEDEAAEIVARAVGGAS